MESPAPVPGALDCSHPGDTAWITVATVLVFLMIPGLALFEGGMLPAKTAPAIFAQVCYGRLCDSSFCDMARAR